MIEALRSWLAEAAPERFDGLRSGSGVIVLGGDRHPEAKVAILLFDDAGIPAVVVKVPRGWTGTAALMAEHDALGKIHAALGTGAQDLGIPEPIAFAEVGGRLALAESVVSGAPLTTRYYRRGHVTQEGPVRADLAMVAAWLRRFREGSGAGTLPLDGSTFETWIGSVFSRFADTFGWDQRLEDLVMAIKGRAHEFDGCPIPLAGLHGDFAIGNVLVAGDRVSGVVDWELGTTAAPPFVDIYKFPLSYGGFLDRAAPEGTGSVAGHPGRHEIGARWSRYGEWPNLIGFAYTFFGRGWFPEMIRSFVMDELNALDLPAGLNSVFFPAFIAHQAMVLPDPVYREGYRTILRAFAAERTHSWLWQSDVRVPL